MQNPLAEIYQKVDDHIQRARFNRVEKIDYLEEVVSSSKVLNSEDRLVKLKDAKEKKAQKAAAGLSSQAENEKPDEETNSEEERDEHRKPGPKGKASSIRRSQSQRAASSLKGTAVSSAGTKKKKSPDGGRESTKPKSYKRVKKT